MTDQPGNDPEERLPAPRPETPAPVERFSSPPGARKFELTPERSAQIVRQSSNARWVGFLAVIVVVLFVALYWFYELGAPLGLTEPRLTSEENAQQVLAVERGYNIYEANCALCHGLQGEGGIGPTLNRQDKLFAHLNEDYLHNILEVGGRLACGDPNSQMPIWSNEGRPPGPLNYAQIEELIAFLRAPNNVTYTMRDPELMEPRIDPQTGEVRTFTGWRDPAFEPAPGATPYPDCWKNEFTSGESAAPDGSSEPSASAPGSSQAPTADELSIVAVGIAFDSDALEVAGTQGFTIQFDNQDTGIQHDVDILDAGGTKVFDGDVIVGADQITYEVPALEAGEYEFICSIHPNMRGTLTVTE
jgi:plastocyanin/mono/diheme cytochrome c family protein